MRKENEERRMRTEGKRRKKNDSRRVREGKKYESRRKKGKGK